MGKNRKSNSQARRRRQPRPEATGRGGKRDQKHVDEDNSSSCWMSLIFAFVALTSALFAAIAFAHATSPISAIYPLDSHDAAGMQLNQKYNSNLQSGKRMLAELPGPESIVVDEQGNWYTGLSDGRLVKITNPGSPSESIIDLSHDADYTVGSGRSARRPLGMRLFQQRLFFADAYQGIFSIDLKTMAWRKIIGFDEVSPPMQFANDLTIAVNGDIYFTDASARWQYSHTTQSFLESRCTGRVFRVSYNTTTATLIKDNLCFANGIELTRDETKLLISESMRQRIIVVNVESGMTEKVIRLHGSTDNIRRSPSGGYWVPLPVISEWTDKYLMRYAFLRNAAAKILGETASKYANSRQGTIVKLNEELDVQEIHQDLDGKAARALTQVQEYEPGKFLLGSYIEYGVVKLDGLQLDKDSIPRS